MHEHVEAGVDGREFLAPAITGDVVASIAVSEVSGGSRLVSIAADQLAAMLAAVNENAVLMQAIAKASRATD